MRAKLGRCIPVLLVCLGLCAALLAVAAAGCGESTLTGDPVATFRESVKDYLGPFQGGQDLRVFTQYHKHPTGYVSGKVVLVDVEARSVPNFQGHLPPKLRATSPAEVGTVVLIKESWRKVGSYSGGVPAMACFWKVSVVDLAKRKVVARVELRGDDPPFVVEVSSGENYGPAPFDELKTYLKRLAPR